jgi:hypothetical protein
MRSCLLNRVNDFEDLFILERVRRSHENSSVRLLLPALSNELFQPGSPLAHVTDGGGILGNKPQGAIVIERYN